MSEKELTSSDSDASHIIIGNGPDGSLELERDPAGLDQAIERNEEDEGDVKPVDMFVPVRQIDRCVRDVRFLDGVVGCGNRLGGPGGHGFRGSHDFRERSTRGLLSTGDDN